MSTLKQDLLTTLELENKQHHAAAEACQKSIESLQNRRREITQKIKELIEADSMQQERLEILRKEHGSLTQELNSKEKELKELNEKLKLSTMQIAFQKDILDLWSQEKYYSGLLDELSTEEALLKLQGYVVLPEGGNELINTIFVSDYLRIGRKDIAELLHALNDPKNHDSIFKKAKMEYSKNPDYNYGIILSLCYEYGYGTKVDKKAAFKIDERFANEKHPLALCSLANEYLDGDIVEVDQKRAIEYYQTAIAPKQELFYLPHYIWGDHLLDGEGVEKDEIRGLELLKIAHEKGIELATITLAKYFSHKITELEETLINIQDAAEGAEQNEPLVTEAEITQAKEQTFYYAKMAFESKSIFGKYLYALCLAKGWGVTQDLGRFLSMMNECRAEGYSPAIADMATEYQFGIQEILPANPLESVKLHFEALRRNYFLAFEQFKELLSNNVNNPTFMDIVYDLFKKCLQGHLLDNPLDSTVIGMFYLEGVLVQRNPKIAILCLQKAADSETLEAATVAATALVRLARSNEHSTLISMSEAHRYLAMAGYSEEMEHVRKHYHSSFMPLFKTLKETWSTIGLGANWAMPDGITHLIADYADTILEEKDQVEKEKKRN